MAARADGCVLSDDSAKKRTNREDERSGRPMITKTFFLAKTIHRIGTRSLRQEKSLPENLAAYRAFFVLRAARQAQFCITL
jgi:hypothetical protein